MTWSTSLAASLVFLAVWSQINGGMDTFLRRMFVADLVAFLIVTIWTRRNRSHS